MPDPTPWSGLTLNTTGDTRRKLTTPEFALSVQASPDAPIGVTVASSIFTAGIEHGLTDWTAIQFQTTGTLPAPLAASTIYYTRDTTAKTLKVASVIGGSALTIATAGTGTLTLRNWSLNDLLESKAELAKDWIYRQLQNVVIQNVRSMSRTAWLWLFPPSDVPATIFDTPRQKAVIVLDNLVNPEALRDAGVDATIWFCAQDAQFRNQIFDPAYMLHGDSAAERLEKRALKTLNEIVPLLEVSTHDGAQSLFDFDEASDSVTVYSI